MLKPMGKKIFYNFTLKNCVYLNLCITENFQEMRVIPDNRVDTVAEWFVTKTRKNYCMLCQSEKVSFSVQLGTKCTDMAVSCDDHS